MIFWTWLGFHWCNWCQNHTWRRYTCGPELMWRDIFNFGLMIMFSVSMTVTPTLWTVLRGDIGGGIGFCCVDLMFCLINLRWPNVIGSGSVRWRRTRDGEISGHELYIFSSTPRSQVSFAGYPVAACRYDTRAGIACISVAVGFPGVHIDRSNNDQIFLTNQIFGNRHWWRSATRNVQLCVRCGTI